MEQDFITMRDVRLYHYKGMAIRVIMDDEGKPWVLGRDIGQVMGLKHAGRMIRDYCKAYMMITPIDSASLRVGTRGTHVIDRSDVYFLCIRYNVMEFHDWFCANVLANVAWVEPEPEPVEVEVEPDPVEVEVREGPPKSEEIQKALVVTTHSIGGEEVTAMDARDLHRFLESKQKFTDWIIGRIEKYDFKENQDFILLHKFMKQTDGRGGHNKKDYFITIDMGKELSMVENNAKGREARQYFIEVDKKYRRGERRQVPKTFTRQELIQLAVEAEEAAQKYQQLASDEKARADKAEKEKAWIGSKKVATAMSTAATAVKRSNKILDDIGMGPKWKSVRAIHWLTLYFKPEFDAITEVEKTLIHFSKVMKKPVKEAEHPMLSYVLTFHCTVIQKFREELDKNPLFLKKYRIAKVYPK